MSKTSLPTRSKHFRITRELGGWTVIHVPTDRGVAYGLKTHVQARMVAGALTGIPWKWGELTKAKAQVGYWKLPETMRAWLRELKRPYYRGEK